MNAALDFTISGPLSPSVRAKAIYRAALVCAKNGDLTAAINYAKDAETLDSENANIKKLLGICLAQRGDFAAAAEALKGTSLEKNVADAQAEASAAFTSIKALMQKNKIRKALPILDALDANTNSPTLRSLKTRACLHAAANQPTQARSVLASAMALDAGDEWIRGAVESLNSESKASFIARLWRMLGR